ncbi:MAG TPA: amidohydrolase/deacetylase family metallohydrolase [Sphingobacteriaceae bacterium]|nr:amidohydrolase/deacetylase family metallohydrolase [Sphingobacteriaceae bacterium]
MKKITMLMLCFFTLNGAIAQTQQYAVVIKGGHVIDPRNKINGKMDVAISREGKIALVAKTIDAKQGTRVVNAAGLYVVPGIIDMHTHNFFGTEPDLYLRNSFYAIPPDGFSFRSGITTVVDAGSAGWKSFEKFKEQTIDRSKTRVLSFLNIVGEGMRGGKFEQDTSDMDARLTAEIAKKYKEHIIGFKVAHYNGADWIPIDRALAASRLSNNGPVMIDFGGGGLSLEELTMKKLRPGDIYTHTFGGGGAGRESIIDPATKKVRPFVFAAQKRGIVWDVGYGGASFLYAHAKPAAREGFFPDVIATDHHGGSMNASMKDILSVMAKFLALGMDVPGVINAVTWKPAQVIRRPELGNLSAGSEGDVSILRIREGSFGFWDQRGERMTGNKKFECEITIKGGRVYYDLNGLTDPVPVVTSGVPAL